MRTRAGLIKALAILLLTMTLKPNEFVEKYHWVYKDTTVAVRAYRGEPITGTLLFAPAEYDETLKAACPGVRFDRFAEYGVDVMDVPHAL